MVNYITRHTHSLVLEKIAALNERLLEQIKEVRQAIESGGGTHDNAMYDGALQAQHVMADQAKQLESYLAKPVFIDDLEVTSGIVCIGSVVRLRASIANELVKLVILGAADMQYLGDKRVISHAAPLARQIIGRHCGEAVLVTLPGGGQCEYLIESAEPYFRS